MARKIKILILEQDPDDFGLLQCELAGSELDYTAETVQTREAYEEALCRFQPDITLSDYGQACFDGLAAFQLQQQLAPGTPFIIVSGAIGDEKAVALIKKGVTDYVLKEKMYQVVPKIRRALQEAADRRQKEAAERQLQQREAHLQKIMDLSLDIICTLDETGCFVAVSAASKLVLDYWPAELIGRSLPELVHEAEREKTATALAGLNQGIDLVNLATCCSRKGGGLVNLLWSVRWDADDNLGYGIAKDITDLKKAGRKIKQHKKRFQTLLQNSTDGLTLVAADGSIVERSSSALKILGFEDATVPATFDLGLIHPEEVAAVRAAMAQVKQRPSEILKVENRFRMPDGSYKWLETTFHNQLHEPAVEAIVLNYRDITENKLAEIALRTSEARLKQAQAIGHMGSWEVKWGENSSSWSDEMFRLFGVEKDAVAPSYEAFLSFIHPEDRAAVVHKLESTGANHQDSAASFRIRRPDGEVRYGTMEWRFEFDESSQPVRLFGIVQDITQRREAEIALEKSEDKYRSLFNLSPTPMWVFEMKTLAFLDVNEAAIRHYGYSKAEFLTMTLRDIRPQRELPVLEALVARLQGSREHCHYIARHRRQSGEVIDVDIRNNFIELGGREARLTIVTDISERMKYIQAIREQNARLREIAWIQSHVVRAPLARLMGLVSLLGDCPPEKISRADILRYISASAQELDSIIRDTVHKTEQVKRQAIVEEQP